MPPELWTIDAYTTTQGEKPAWSFIYMFLPNRVAVLLDGEVKKQDAIPERTLARLRGYQKEIVARSQKAKKQEKRR